MPIDGFDSPGVHNIHTVDVWVTGGADLYVNADVHGRSRPGTSSGDFNYRFKYADVDYGGPKNGASGPRSPWSRELKKGKRKPAADLLVAVRRGAFPSVENKNEDRRIVPTGLSNGVQVTPLPPASSRDATWDLESALLALATQVKR